MVSWRPPGGSWELGWPPRPLSNRPRAPLGTLTAFCGALTASPGAPGGLPEVRAEPFLLLYVFACSWDALGCSWRDLWAVLGGSWALLGVFWSVFGRSWLQTLNFQKTLKNMWKNDDFCRSSEARIALKGSWVGLGSSWDGLEPLLGALGPLLRDLGSLLGDLESVLGDLDSLLGALGSLLGGLGIPCSAFWGVHGALDLLLGGLWGPCSLLLIVIAHLHFLFQLF